MDVGVLLILFVVYFIAYEVLYHKCFKVYYFSLGHGLAREFGTATVVAFLTVLLTVWLWWLAAIAFILVGLGLSTKVDNPKGKLIIIGIFVVIALIVGATGLKFKNDYKKSEEEKQAMQEAEEVYASYDDEDTYIAETENYYEDELMEETFEEDSAETYEEDAAAATIMVTKDSFVDEWISSADASYVMRTTPIENSESVIVQVSMRTSDECTTYWSLKGDFNEDDQTLYYSGVSYDSMINEEGTRVILDVRNDLSGTINILEGDILEWSEIAGTTFVRSGYAIESEQFIVVTAPDGYVNMRSSDSTDSLICMEIPTGVYVKLLSEGEKWSEVEYGNVIGYVANSQVTKC